MRGSELSDSFSICDLVVPKTSLGEVFTKIHSSYHDSRFVLSSNEELIELETKIFELGMTPYPKLEFRYNIVKNAYEAGYRVYVSVDGVHLTEGYELTVEGVPCYDTLEAVNSYLRMVCTNWIQRKK